MRTSTAVGSRRTSASLRPEASFAWGPRYLSAMTAFSSETYPLTSNTYIRSRRGDGMVSRLLANVVSVCVVRVVVIKVRIDMYLCKRTRLSRDQQERPYCSSYPSKREK